MKIEGTRGGTTGHAGRRRPDYYRPKARAAVGFRWWRADRYDVTDTAICPVGRVKPFYVSLSDVRWEELATWGRDGSLSVSDRRAVRDWCQTFGLPGYLLTTTRVIGLPSLITLDDRSKTPEWERWPTYMRHGGVWVAEAREMPCCEENRLDPNGWVDLERLPGDWTYDAETYEGGSAPLSRWQPSLTCPVTKCPLPGSSEFWQVYREPLALFFEAGRAVGRVLSEYREASAKPLMQHLLQQNGFVSGEDGTPVWTGASLVAGIAISLLIQGKTLKACKAACGVLIPAGRADQEYCSPRCSERAKKQRQRSKKNSSS